MSDLSQTTTTDHAPSYEDDLPLDVASRAHQGTSHVPDQRGQQERRSYATTLRMDLERLAKLATTDEKKATLAQGFEAYREGYRSRMIRVLEAKSHCVSTMITGPANFPTGRAQKRSATADDRYNEAQDYRRRALSSLTKALTPEKGPIRLEDKDAAPRIQSKLAALKSAQETMVASNAAIRAQKKAGTEAQVTALVALGHTEARARQLLTPDFARRIGFPDYALRNNLAQIKRLEAREKVVAEVHATPAATVEGTEARLEDAPTDNRVRLFFPGKPDETVRARLKTYGFRWAPTLGCWQAYRNDRSLRAAREFAGV